MTDDYLRFKISNHIIINGFIWGVVLITLEIFHMILKNNSLIHVENYIFSCAEGLLIPFLLLIPFFLAGGIGAGDIKLLCIIGMIINGREIVKVLIIMLPVAACMCFAIIIKNAYLRKKRRRLHKIHLSYAVAMSWGIYLLFTAFIGK